ncbi:MAG: hypothetical protein S4CHLAM6_10970 [Chlamydiae bacterium]|nr:hypothetical protein [Chlamydiota bacterium]
MKKNASISQSISKYKFNFQKFKSLSQTLNAFKKPAFKKLIESEQYTCISEKIFQEIGKHKAPCFLLPAIVDFIDQTNNIIKPQEYTFSYFEFWLNQHSGLSVEENYLIRSKIVGKHVPRNDYQSLFPIGMNKCYAGSHYVTAHGSPDLDTTIASFWGWVDAFGARVCSGLHIWNVPPGGILASKDAAPLTDVFSSNIFQYLCLNRSSLSPIGIDFASQKDLIKKDLSESSISPDDHERHKYAVMVVDSKGFYIGDIRSEDYESIRQIIRLVTNNLKWFENSIQNKLIDLFSQKNVTQTQVISAIKGIFNQKLIQCLNKKQLTQKLHDQVDAYLKKILKLNEGFEASFKELGSVLKKLKISKLGELDKHLQLSFKKNKVFDAKGTFKDNRAAIFKSFNEISKKVDDAIEELCNFMESLDVAIKIKRQVFGFSARYVTPITTIDEIQDKMSVLNHLSVVYPNKDGSFWPLGVIKSEDIKQGKLGTVTLRDFCNRSEVKIDSNLEIISVIDHHKTELKTKTAPLAITGDVQSCNVLVAEQAFKINDSYSHGGVEKATLNKQLKANAGKTLTDSIIRTKNRVLKRLLAQNQSSQYFIDPQREFFEYLSFLHAIIDDTDLLSKATQRDVYCIAELLNRMKSIADQKETEIINFDHLKDDADFVSGAVKEIVSNREMYLIYKSIFNKRETAVEEAIVDTAQGKSTEFFSDTKEQNSCCRVGQSKVFKRNIPTLEKNFEKLITQWAEKANEIYSNHELLDLHVQMISTIPSADDVYKGKEKSYSNKDYIWIWIPNTPQAVNHLTSFLNAFKSSAKVQTNKMEYQILGSDACDYQSIFTHHFIATPAKQKLKIKKKMPVVILSFDAGTLNSRKAQITPYLPALVK